MFVCAFVPGNFCFVQLDMVQSWLRSGHEGERTTLCGFGLVHDAFVQKPGRVFVCTLLLFSFFFLFSFLALLLCMSWKK